MNFSELNLCQTLLRNIDAQGYTTPTPIQVQTIPVVLTGRDVLGCAQTGTGKTAAFALPILEKLNNAPRKKDDPTVIRTLILTPTRELAQQIYECFLAYGKGIRVTPAVIFGGVSQNPQVEALHRGADIVIACPGRLWDLMNQGYVRLDSVDTFVLDEADRMLDMGFIHDVRRIVGKLTRPHQTLMFSATMPEEVEKLAMDILHDPASVKVDPVSSTVDKIDQHLYYIDKANKKHLLAKIVSQPECENALVFSRTRHGADRIVRELRQLGIDSRAIHGDKSQAARQAALNDFKSGRCRVLIATDIAARGIDIDGLSHVINYDLPMEPESYVHRIGRTGRAGRDGIAITMCCIDEMKQLHQVEKLIGKRIPLSESEWPMLITTPTDPKEKEARRLAAKAAHVARVNARGEAVKMKKSAPAKEAPKASHAGTPIVIGRDGKVSARASAAKAAPKLSSARPAVQREAKKSTRPQHTAQAQKAPQSRNHGKPAPVQRVNRHRNKG